jgi:hypothetical protein
MCKIWGLESGYRLASSGKSDPDRDRHPLQLKNVILVNFIAAIFGNGFRILNADPASERQINVDPS